MADLTFRFVGDLAQLRGAFADVKRLAAQVGKSSGAGAFKGEIAGARNAGKSFAAAGQAARGASGEMSRAQTRSQRFFAVVRTGAKAAGGLAAIGVALVALNRKFPAIGQVAAKSLGIFKTEAAAAGKAVGGLFAKIADNIPKAAKAAMAIHAVVAAFRALKNAPKPPTPRFPSPRRAGFGSGRRGFGGLGKAFAPLAIGAGIGMAGAGIFGALKDQIGGAMQKAATFEQIEVSFEVLTGGLAPARKALGELRQLSENTPLKFADVAGAGRQLLAFGEAQDQVADTLGRIGDIAGGVMAPIGEIAEIYGKARVQGTLFAEDINQLTGRGIPVLSEFAAILGTTPDQIKKLASEGQITFPLLEQAFQNLTNEGGIFFQMNEKLSRTVGGLWSTLTDRISTAMEALGTPINDALRPLLAEAVELAGGLRDRATEFGERIAGAIDFVRAAFQTLSGGEIFQAIGQGLTYAFQTAVDVLVRGVSAVVSAFQDAEFLGGLEAKFSGIFAMLKDTLLAAVEAAMRSLSDLPGLGEDFARAAESIDYERQIDRMNRDAADRARERAGLPEVDLTKKIAEFYRGSEGIFGKSRSQLEKDLGALLAPVFAKMEENRKAREKTDGTEKPKPTREGLIPTGGGGGLGAVVGSFQRAVNLIQGKTVNEYIAENQRKANDLLAGLNRDTKDVKRAVEEVARNTKKGPPKVEVSVVPTFGDAAGGVV